MGLLQPSEVGRVIRLARDGKGLTQEQVAEALGVNQSLVSYWERGVHAPGLEHRSALAELLEIPVQDLVLSPDADVAAS